MQTVNNKIETFFSSKKAIDNHILLTPVKFVRGVGPYMATLLSRIGIENLWHLLCHIPIDYEKRHYIEHLDMAYNNKKVSIILVPQKHIYGDFKKRQPIKILCNDSQHKQIELIFFNSHKGLFQQTPIGVPVAVSGDLEYFMGHARMLHPDHMGEPKSLSQWTGHLPIYGLTSGITQKKMQSFIKSALEMLPAIQEWLPQEVISKHGFPSIKDAFYSLHNASNKSILSPLSSPLRRLAYDEVLAHSIAIQRLRMETKQQDAYALKTNKVHQAIIDSMQFNLTSDQEKAINEIILQMHSGRVMTRLLQGDVGSGKTAVAFAMLASLALEGVQGAIMAPTEILARQHAHTISIWAEKIDLKVAVLTGNDKGKGRKNILENIHNGNANIIIGTHSLFQDDVVFKHLKGIIIDEQHRFGVEQRLRLVKKGPGAHLLSMTATPIPRTLLLALNGDLDVSILRQKPALRQPVHTAIMSSKKLIELIDGLKRAVSQGKKVFWVCPLVEDSEKLSLTSAESRFEELHHIIGEKVGLIHGKMKGEEKEEILQAFRNGEFKILVTTTVIEVGVDIPDATTIIIEHAERYGLAQLHQLRGRVGRGSEPGNCVLIYSYPISNEGRDRLEMMKKSNDGFELAEADLQMRGAGQITGYKQSGVHGFKFLDFAAHSEIIECASKVAQSMINDTVLTSIFAHHAILKATG